MATSGTVSTTQFTTRQVIDHAYRRCRLGAQQITSEMIDIANDQLYLILSNLAKMSDKALELRDLAAGISDNEEWVQEKIAVASAMIDSIHNYLKYRKD